MPIRFAIAAYDASWACTPSAGCTLSETASPRSCSPARKACGSGKRSVFQV